MSSGTKKSAPSGWLGSTRYGSKSLTPSRARNVSSMRKLPLKLDRLLEDAPGGVGEDLGLARHAHDRVAAEQVLDRGGGDGGARPQRVDRDLALQFAGEAEHDQAHAELGHGIGGVRREPFHVHVERRRQHQNVRARRFQQMRDGVFRHHEGAARVDLMHEIEALHVGLRDRRERDGAGIVDHDVEAAEMRGGLIERGLDGGLVAHVDHEGERLAAGFFDFAGRGVDGAFQLGVRLDRLGGDGDIGAVARSLERDGEPDAARGAGDEKRFSLERHRFPRLLCVLFRFSQRSAVPIALVGPGQAAIPIPSASALWASAGQAARSRKRTEGARDACGSERTRAPRHLAAPRLPPAPRGAAEGKTAPLSRFRASQGPRKSASPKASRARCL